jgi:hypothetical protein
MLVKWMTCRVPTAYREWFCAAQQRWWPLAGEAGFVCQIGGFDRRAPQTACILALWDGSAAYERFMTSAHDRLQRETGQAGSYESLHVDVGDLVLEMPGAAAGPAASLTGSRLLRVADCTVRPDREEHFRGVQQQVWAPAMARADGMLGGVFARLASGRYLVATGWRDQSSHDAYQHEQVSDLSTRADNSHDLTHLQGYAIELRTGGAISGSGDRPFRTSGG